MVTPARNCYADLYQQVREAHPHWTMQQVRDRAFDLFIAHVEHIAEQHPEINALLTAETSTARAARFKHRHLEIVPNE